LNWIQVVEEEEGPKRALGEVVGNRGSKRGCSESLGVVEGEGCKKNPFSLIAFSSASMFKTGLGLPFPPPETVVLLNGSGIRGVTGLRTSAGKSRMLGDKISGFLGEKLEGLFEFEEKTGSNGFRWRFFREFLLS